MNDDVLWKVTDVARFLRCSVRQVQLMAQRGEIPSVRLTPRMLRFSPAAIKAISAAVLR
jgi:hypothetical protein